jgi:putative peptide zinc metalloprotease protein
MPPDPAATLLDSAPRLAPGIAARRVEASGRPAWVLHNPATGRFFQASPRLHRLAGLLDGRRRVADALGQLPPDAEEDEATLLAGLSGMVAAGLLILPGARPPAPKRDHLAPLRALVFRRFRAGDLGPALTFFNPLLGWLFSRPGAAVLAALLAAAAIALAGRGAELEAQFQRIAGADLGDLLVGYAVFIAAKALHEAGHAVALRRLALREGIGVDSVPWGISFMFLLPAPYVDASAAWLLHSRWRRAAVGLAGVATDLLVAALAALAWAASGPGAAADRLFDLMLICSVSSLLFNLNPLVRLDGYHVLADLLGVPNLMARAQAGLARLLLGPLRLAPLPRRGDLPAALYAVLSWAYRWTIYLAVFWIAAELHPALGLVAAVTIGVLFAVVPLLKLARATPGAAREAPAGAALAGLAGLALIAGAMAVPLPRSVVAEGIVSGPGLVLAYPRADGRLVRVAPPGIAGEAPLIVLENVETARLLTQLRAEAESLAIEARRARAAGAERIDAAVERERAVAVQIARLEEERAQHELRAPGARWEPLRGERLAGAWVRRDDQRPLGALLRADAPAEIRLVLDQWDGPAALAAAARNARIPMRLAGGTVASFFAEPLGAAPDARESLPSPALGTPGGGRIPARLDEREEARPLERVYELRLRPEGDSPPLHPGARVEARIALPPAPLAEQAWRRARQALQRRLAV